MSLLHDYFKIVEKFKVDENELRKICHVIQEQENPKFKAPAYLPQGESIFLALERNINPELIEYVTLEKDNSGYFVGYWRDGKRIKSWFILEPDAYHVVLGYVRIYKQTENFLNSEDNVY